MGTFTVLLVLFILGVGWVIEKIQGAKGHRGRSSNTYTHSQGSTRLPKGYSRQDYYQYGYTDADIECWGLDQPGAPSPAASGFAIADMMDGDLDGDIDFPF